MDDFTVPSHLITKTRKYDLGYGIVGTLGTKKDTDGIPSYLQRQTLVGNFTSVGRFVDFIREVFTEPRFQKSSSKESGKDWTTYSYDTAIKVFSETPWEVVEFDANDNSLKSESESGNDVTFDVTGEFFDVGRYLDDVPEMFGVSHNGKNRGKFANIIIAGDYGYSINKETIITSQKRVTRLIDWLEHNNIRTRVTVIFSSDNAHLQIQLKDYQDPLEIKNIAVATHDSFFRRLVFRWIEHSKTASYGYGSSVAFSNWFRRNNDKKDKYADKNGLDVFIDQFDSPEQANSHYDRAEKELSDAIESEEYVYVKI